VAHVGHSLTIAALNPLASLRWNDPTGFHREAVLDMPPCRTSCLVLSWGISMPLLRASAQQLAAWVPFDSAVEQMTEQMLYQYLNRPSPSEQRSWARSIPALARDLADAGLGSAEVLLEQRLPLTSRRVDAIVAGVHPRTGRPSYVVVELKQWSSTEVFQNNASLVVIDGYGHEPHIHPGEQVAGYCQYLADFIPALGEQEAHITGVAYLHNATELAIRSLRTYTGAADIHLITGERRNDLMKLLRSQISTEVSGSAAADLLLNAREAPSRPLLAVAAQEIREREQFVLLDEQKLAYNLVLHAVERAREADVKTVIVVSGGPGSGKSVIALSLLGELARQGRAVLHATGSQSFTQTLRKVAGWRSKRTQQLFKYFNSFMDAERNSLDVLILDEAHRIRQTSANRWTKTSQRTQRPQLDELMAAARVPVFLLDEHQTVRPGELGSLADIKAHAASHSIAVQHISLEDQFRCGGSEAYVEWVMRLLGLSPGGPSAWSGDEKFTLSLAHTPEELEAAMAAQERSGYTARVTAGYCWPWSDPNRDGSLVSDVVIGDWRKPWNLKGDRSTGGAPPSALWATDPAGFGQVGCIYTAQGFEYDWNGVILGPDLVWREDRWVPRRAHSRDPAFRSATTVSDAQFDGLIRNVYKVLLTRGMIGTVVYSTDAQTRSYLTTLIRD